MAHQHRQELRVLEQVGTGVVHHDDGYLNVAGWSKPGRRRGGKYLVVADRIGISNGRVIVLLHGKDGEDHKERKKYRNAIPPAPRRRWVKEGDRRGGTVLLLVVR